jgi:thiosulfate/3-mercaptopyruvate sulfurtransferase
MKFNTLISADGLAQNFENPEWVVIDCRFQLDDTKNGLIAYQKNHIPGALYAHLDEDLSAPIIPGKTGRHPLPNPNMFAHKLGDWGIGNDTQVVVYDDDGGKFAARLWWLLRWLGHETVAVLNGGYSEWITFGLPVTSETSKIEADQFIPDIQRDMISSAQDVLKNFGNPGMMLIDSRAPERFSGELEPIDPVAGRIPGSINYFWGNNLTNNGEYQLKQILRGRFENLFGDIATENVTFYCGSGVTAAHNILAVVHSDLGMPRLYAGSWSEWITDPERPITKG